MFYITISNGLLQDGHHERMGNAVWLFMWCIDKVTKVDDKGFGWVLGGKPIQLEDITHIPRRTAQRYMSVLKKEGYIVTTRTPYGIVIKVVKAKKTFKRDVTGLAHQKHRDATKVAHLNTKNGASNKTVSVDNTRNTREQSSRPLKASEDTMREYREDQHADELPAIDADTGEKVEKSRPKVSETQSELIKWAEARRGRPFLTNMLLKQKKAFTIARANNITAAQLEARWKKMETEEFWKVRGFDWMDVVLDFNKRA